MKLYLLCSIGFIASHSWLDCIGSGDQIYHGPEQFFDESFYQEYCLGYPRAYPGRLDRDINTKFTYIVNNRGGPNHDASVCKTSHLEYTPKFPMTRVKAGTNIKFWYEMDNHYKPETKVHIFSYGKPNSNLIRYYEMSPATELLIHIFATPGNCINVNSANSFCWAYWRVPHHWSPGIYSFLWNWRYDRNPSGEEYNSCFDIEVII